MELDILNGEFCHSVLNGGMRTNYANFSLNEQLRVHAKWKKNILNGGIGPVLNGGNI